ncbi:MAG: MBL fold metallo-hydrolase [Desulfobacteraceae bacterium]|jgi:glyoxylase-like metal-dependent hydrolase (beta-lactamase superfamily II)
MQIIQMEFGDMANFSYLVGCDATAEAMVIDPAIDARKIYNRAIKEGLTVKTIVNTHGHGDHTAGNAELKALTGARIVIHALDADSYPDADLRLCDEKKLDVGRIRFEIFHTPGHTPGGICLYAQGNVFTGDTLFVGDSGRTDLPGGHRPTLGASIRRLMKLPDQTVVWPGHNYGPTTCSTISWEKRHNVNAREYGYYVADGAG